MSDLPRLLLCVFDVVPAPTALSRRVTEYLKGLSDRYQVVVLSVKTPDHPHIERYHGARLLRVPVGQGDLAARVQSFDRAVRRQLDSEEYVMVHSFDPFGGYALAERRPEFGYKFVYDACALPSVELPFLVSEEDANRRFIAKVRRQELFCLMNADMVIVASELTRDFVTSLGVQRDQVQRLPPPVDLTPYAPEVMGEPDGEPMKLLHLGHQGTSQDLGTLLDAMQLALRTVNVSLVFVGPKIAPLQAQLEAQVARLELADKVEFQPPVAHEDLHKVLATADVGLLTLADVERNSRVGSPLSRAGEYLAAGRPVIAADVPAARGALPEDGVVYYRAHDASALAAVIIDLAQHPARRVELGRAARTAAINYDSARVRADLVAAYVSLSGAGVRAIGDAAAANPDEPTQLGRAAAQEDSQRTPAPREADTGNNRAGTDPAIAAGESTTPEAAVGARPAIMGTPLRDEPAVVVGRELYEYEGSFSPAPTTDPAARPPEQPVVMGSPIPTAPDFAKEEAAPPPPAVQLREEPATPAPPVTYRAEAAAPLLTPPRPAGGGISQAPPTELQTSARSTAGGIPQTLPEPPVESSVVAAPADTGEEEAPFADDAELIAGTPARGVPSAQGTVDEEAPFVDDADLIAGTPALGVQAASPKPVPPPLPKTPSGVFPPPSAPRSIPPSMTLNRGTVPPPLPRSTSGVFAAIGTTPTPSAPPPLPRSTSGVFAVANPPPAAAKPTGLFPEPPSVPKPPPAPPPPAPAPVEAAESLPEEEPEDLAVQTVDTDVGPPTSAIEPWFAQLVHGYCPPASSLFARHTPPTTMPGRDT